MGTLHAVARGKQDQARLADVPVRPPDGHVHHEPTDGFGEGVDCVKEPRHECGAATTVERFSTRIHVSP